MTISVLILGLIIGLVFGCFFGYNLFKLGLANALVSNSVKKVVWNPDIFAYRTVKVLSVEDLSSLKVKNGDCFMITMSNVKES